MSNRKMKKKAILEYDLFIKDHAARLQEDDVISEPKDFRDWADSCMKIDLADLKSEINFMSNAVNAVEGSPPLYRESREHYLRFARESLCRRFPEDPQSVVLQTRAQGSVLMKESIEKFKGRLDEISRRARRDGEIFSRHDINFLVRYIERYGDALYGIALSHHENGMITPDTEKVCKILGLRLYCDGCLKLSSTEEEQVCTQYNQIISHLACYPKIITPLFCPENRKARGL